MAKNCKPSIIIPDKYSVVVVQNITERNHISCKIRQNGMIAVVVEEGYAQYQIRTQEGLYSVCNNNAWVKISTGDKVFDSSNLIILNNEEHKQKYLQSGLAVKGQMIFYVPENKYYRYDGYNFVDPFYNKLDKGTYTGTASDLKSLIDTKADLVNGKVPASQLPAYALNITVWSENGNVFTNGAIKTTLVATVFKGAEDITDLIPSNRFNWIRQSSNPDGDSVWNSLHKAKGKSINITDEDFSRSASFSVEIDIPEELLF